MKTQKSKARSFKNGAALILALLSMLWQGTGFAYDGTLIPIGETVGITVKSGNLRILDTTDFEGEDGNAHCPASDAGICSGDIIISINGREIASAEELEEMTDSSKGKPISVKVKRNNKEIDFSVTPIKSADEDRYRMGLWIKDSSSGIGTLTFYNEETGEFAALGHGICDETDVVTDIKSGNIYETEITSIAKGEKGIPGELMAIFSENGKTLGKVHKNTNRGIFGTFSEKYEIKSPQCEMPVTSREEVEEGDATILSNIEGNKIEEYSVQIAKINKDENDDKCMIIKVTDERLLSKTGGIVRGMSGSPIIQNGRIVGAVTHVFVNDPTRGYGIFIENMLTEAEKIK